MQTWLRLKNNDIGSSFTLTLPDNTSIKSTVWSSDSKKLATLLEGNDGFWVSGDIFLKSKQANAICKEQIFE